MSTLTTILSTDLITDSRVDINDNFSALNTDKMETSVLDTDTTLASNSDAKVATQKAVKAYVDAQTLTNAVIETTTGTTHSLTTTASQKVIVWAKGQVGLSAGATGTLTIKYNGVTKDTVVAATNESNSKTLPFALMYTETPGAGTQNVVVATDSGSLANVVIIVYKY